MNRQDLAAGLLELWSEYVSSSTRVFQPTMTDFMQYLKEHQPNESSNSERTTPLNVPASTFRGEPITDENIEGVKAYFGFEADDTQYAGEVVLSKEQKREIKNLYNNGYSLARVRDMLGLKGVSLYRLQNVVKRP